MVKHPCIFSEIFPLFLVWVPQIQWSWNRDSEKLKGKVSIAGSYSVTAEMVGNHISNPKDPFYSPQRFPLCFWVATFDSSLNHSSNELFFLEQKMLNTLIVSKFSVTNVGSQKRKYVWKWFVAPRSWAVHPQLGSIALFCTCDMGDPIRCKVDIIFQL